MHISPFRTISYRRFIQHRYYPKPCAAVAWLCAGSGEGRPELCHPTAGIPRYNPYFVAYFHRRVESEFGSAGAPACPGAAKAQNETSAAAACSHCSSPEILTREEIDFPLF